MLRARQKIGKYRILGRIASGPLADVYRAFDTIHKTRVALKIPKSGDHTGEDEFLHEVQVAAKLKHANILSVINASYIDEHFVIAMELGDESLADRIERRISSARALDLAGQALASLAYAHENKIIHCDIKPENFILFPGNQLKLAGSGTIDYIAPEQAMGRPKFQSDVFSIGLVLYRLFSGTLPEWPFEWPMAGHDKLVKRVRPELVLMLKKAIQLDPAKRYRNAIQMYADFEKLQSHARRQKKPKAKAIARNGSAWRQVQWREFQRQYRKVLDTSHHCRSCEGPVAENMQACPWCGFDNPARGSESSMPSSCPRCERGVKNDWDYCAWCYGSGFVESKHSCKACKWGIAKEFWNYCAWCREPVRRD
jgi:serine/threonine-protein kinase